jgi:hypothetical protein
MATVAKEKAAPKAERKKPVRKAPVQKDYSSKLEWLKAMTEYELAQSEVTSAAKVKRLDKRIAAKQAQIDKLETELAKLLASKEELAPTEETEPAVDDEAGVPQA